MYYEEYRRRPKRRRRRRDRRPAGGCLTALLLRYAIKPKDFVHGGEASSKIKRALERLGARPQTVRRVAVATYEAWRQFGFEGAVGKLPASMSSI